MIRRAVAGIGVAVTLAGCGGDQDGARGPAPDKAAGHVHGLGVTGDGALYVATHSGLFSAPAGSADAERVGTSFQDTMGFTVTRRGEFLGSGHPDARTDDPPMLGFIRSRDRGRTWQPVSLRGEADLHVLRTAGTRYYGADSVSGRLLVSDDGGRTWAARTPPGPVVDLAANPDDPDEVLAATEDGLAVSHDTGERWRPVDGPAGLLAWPRAGTLIAVDATGKVWRAGSVAGPWQPRGEVGGQPAALAARGGDLYVGLHDGAVKRSADGGATWSPRARVPVEAPEAR